MRRMKRGLNLPGDRPPWETAAAGRGDCARLSVAIGPSSDGEPALLLRPLLLSPDRVPHFFQLVDRFCPSIPNRHQLLLRMSSLLLLLFRQSRPILTLHQSFLLADQGLRPRSLGDDAIHPQRASVWTEAIPFLAVAPLVAADCPAAVAARGCCVWPSPATTGTESKRFSSAFSALCLHLLAIGP